MTWTITPQYLGAAVFDPDAQAYLLAVEAADGQPLEPAVAIAVNDFVVGCKADGIWNAIKASCILAGARTLSGALVPLVGTAPTNVNFVSGDYNRETGLVGNGSTKYLDSNRAGNADPQDSAHLSCWVSTIHNPQAATPVNSGGVYIGNGGTGSGATHFGRVGGAPPGSTFARNRNSAGQLNIDSNPPPTGMYGMNRLAAGSYTMRIGGTNYALTQTSEAPAAENHFVFARNNGAGSAELGYVTGRLSFYSIGESLDLALLGTRVTTLINALAAAIP